MTDMMKMGYMELLLGYVVYNNLTYLPIIILALLKCCNIRYYVLPGDKDRYKRILKRIHQSAYFTKSRYVNGKSLPAGCFIGPKCVGYYDNFSRYIEEENLYLITTTSNFQNLISDEELHFPVTDSVLDDPDKESESESDLLICEQLSKVKDDKPKKENTYINVFVRGGNYKHFYYSPIKLNVAHINPINGQGEIVTEIVKIYKKKSRATVFIHGVSGAGKSAVGYLVAKAVNGNFCHTFRPTDPGDGITNMISEIKNRDDEDTKPLIIILEEVNELIGSIHNKTIKMNVETPTPVFNKSTWCSFLDDMIFYNDIILILTSNETKEYIDELDKAYLRQGRLDKTFSMMTPIDLSCIA